MPRRRACSVLTATGRSSPRAVGGVNTKPYVVDTSVLIGTPVTRDLADEVAERAREAADDPYTDVLADGAYRQQVSGVVAKRALLDAAT